MKSNNILNVLEHYLKERKDLNDMFYDVISEKTEELRRAKLTKLCVELIGYIEQRNHYKCRY